MENNIEDVNTLMHNFLDNRNTLAKINTELTNTFGKEYYLSKLSNTLVEAFNSFEKFYPIIEDKEKFAHILDDLANTAVNFFTISTKENLGKMNIFKKKRILKKELPENKKKLDELLDKFDLANDFITKSVEKYNNENL